MNNIAALSFEMQKVIFQLHLLQIIPVIRD